MAANKSQSRGRQGAQRRGSTQGRDARGRFTEGSKVAQQLGAEGGSK